MSWLASLLIKKEIIYHNPKLWNHTSNSINATGCLLCPWSWTSDCHYVGWVGSRAQTYRGYIFDSTGLWLWFCRWGDLFRNDRTGQRVMNRKWLLGEVNDESLLGINVYNILCLFCVARLYNSTICPLLVKVLQSASPIKCRFTHHTYKKWGNRGRSLSLSHCLALSLWLSSLSTKERIKSPENLSNESL